MDRRQHRSSFVFHRSRFREVTPETKPMPTTDPVAALVLAARAELVKAGLERVECEGSIYFRGGKAGAPIVVLIHGVNDQAGTWAPVVPALAGRFRLIVPDLAGHGESGPNDGP